MKSSCLLLLALTACDGQLDPLEKLPVAAAPHPPTPGLHVVEPFEYHYPDEPFFDSISSELQLVAARGQTDVGALVYVPSVSGELRLTASELVATTGQVIPAENIELGVVTYADRSRAPNGLDPADRLTMAYTSGARRGGAAGDFRGFHQDARERLPLVPLVIAPDAIELAARISAATDYVTLTESAGARGWGEAGLGLELWVRIKVPVDLELAEPITHLRGSLELDAPSGAATLPLSAKVYDFQLDGLSDHGRYAGVTDTLEHNAPELRQAILSDLREHGVNALREAVPDLAGYDELASNGFAWVINTSESFPAADIPLVAASGLQPLFNVPLFEPTPEELSAAIAYGQDLQAEGAQLESEMTLAVARSAEAALQFDAFAYAVTTYELSDLHRGEQDEFLALLAAIRSDPAAKEVPLSGHYAEVFNGHAPHQARLLYGFWLAQSNLDFGMAYGYSMVDGANPFTDTTHHGVAFPAQFTHADGAFSRYAMLPSLTWEAFRAGIDDWRYVLTARRLLAQDPDRSARLDELLAPYGPLYDAAGDRVDYRQREADTRATRAAIADLIAEVL